MAGNLASDRRRHERYALAPMYTHITARRSNDADQYTGHAYDISESGLRIELDDDVTPGDSVELELHIAGEPGDVHATVEVVRVFEPDDDPGPRRMGVQFRDFRTADDRERLLSWLGSGHLQRAA